MNNPITPILDKLKSKYRNHKYKENEYYEFHYTSEFDPAKHMVGIKLLQGPYANVAYTYDTFFIKKENSDGSALGTFDITIHENGPLVDANKDNLPKKLNKIISDIFLCILEASIKATNNISSEIDSEETAIVEEETPKRTRRKKDKL